MVPIVIHNAGDVAPKGDFVFRSATVEVDVLPPIDTSNWTGETIEEHVAEVRDMFLDVLGQRRDSAARPAYRQAGAGEKEGDPARKQGKKSLPGRHSKESSS